MCNSGASFLCVYLAIILWFSINQPPHKMRRTKRPILHLSSILWVECCTNYIYLYIYMAAAHAGGNFVEKRRCGLINFIKTPNPRCRLHRCLIEFIDWRYSQSCWYFRPALWTIAPLTFSLVSSLPLSCVNKYIYCIHVYSEWGRGSMHW